MKVSLPDCHVLRTVKLPARDPYPETYIASLYQEGAGDLFNVVCTEECFDALEMTDRDAAVTVEARARQIDLGALGASEKGKVWRLRATRCIPGEGSPALRSQAAAGDKQAAGLHDGGADSGLRPTRRPR
jgi:hypothetical protein